MYRTEFISYAYSAHIYREDQRVAQVDFFADETYIFLYRSVGARPDPKLIEYMANEFPKATVLWSITG